MLVKCQAEISRLVRTAPESEKLFPACVGYVGCLSMTTQGVARCWVSSHLAQMGCNMALYGLGDLLSPDINVRQAGAGKPCHCLSMACAGQL